MKRYKILLRGCDDSTIFEVELNHAGFEIVEQLSKKSYEVSTYGCMPILDIEEIENH